MIAKGRFMAYGGAVRSLERVYDGRALGVAGKTLQSRRKRIGEARKAMVRRPKGFTVADL